MGSGSYSRSAWKGFSSSRGYHKASTTYKDIYKRGNVHADMDPKNFKIRESVDGDDNPNSTPVIIGLDVTGSMASVLEVIAKQGLKTVCEEIYNRKPIVDPHVCVLGIGDVYCDSGPFQATQFEADIRIFQQLEQIWLEMGGGGNDHESYILAWYFAKFRTKTDSFSKRGIKGSIFTIGDEEITPKIEAHQFKEFMGDDDMRDYSCRELFDLVFPEWNVYHIIIKEGSHARHDFAGVLKSWEEIIGKQRVIALDDHTKIGETIVSVLELAAGKTLKDTADSWDGSTSLVINDALKNMAPAIAAGSKGIDALLE